MLHCLGLEDYHIVLKKFTFVGRIALRVSCIEIHKIQLFADDATVIMFSMLYMRTHIT